MRPDWPNAWAAVRERMRRELGDPVFEAWIGPLNLESAEHDELRIGAAKPFVRNWVANHYVARIERAFRAEGAEPASISIVISAAPSPVVAGGVIREAPHRAMSAICRRPCAATEPEDGARGLWTRMLHPQQTFDSFIPGRANEFGHGAARAFAEGQQSRHPAALHPWRLRLRKNTSAECRGAGIPQARHGARCSCGPRISCATSWARSIARTRWPSRKSCAPPKC